MKLQKLCLILLKLLYVYTKLCVVSYTYMYIISETSPLKLLLERIFYGNVYFLFYVLYCHDWGAVFTLKIFKSIGDSYFTTFFMDRA